MGSYLRDDHGAGKLEPEVVSCWGSGRSGTQDKMRESETEGETERKRNKDREIETERHRERNRDEVHGMRASMGGDVGGRSTHTVESE